MRQCEECGTQMPPFQARITVQGRKVCGDCVGLMALAALENPIHDRTKKHPEEWFHGSPYGFEGFSDPAARHDQDEEEESGRFNHWNILVGNHFTSDHSVAHDFSEGLHHSEVHNDEPLKHVVHVKLHVQNPKVYKSEHDMDQDVYEWEHGENRNFHDNYEQPESDDWDWDDDRATQERRKYRGDSQAAYSKHDYEGSHPKATGWLNTHPDKEGIARRYKERMQRAGYDGVIYGNEYENSRHGQAAKSAIAFEPHQIEITQHHYGHGGCLSDEEAKRRAVHPDQEMLPGTEDMDRKLPKKREVDVTKVWPKTWTPSYFHGDRTRHREPPIGHPDDQSGLNVWGALQRENTGRLSAPLPQECWDRYYGRHTGSQRRTAAAGDPTDWDKHYDPGMEVHRGMFAKVPWSLWQKLHDPEQVKDAAQDLADRTSRRASTGMHWSADLEQARDFGSPKSTMSLQLPVVLHAQVPGREAIETRPSMLKRNGVFPHEHREREVPLRKGSGVDVFGVSWKPEGPHPAADKNGWVRHDFIAPVRHTAAHVMRYTTMGPQGYQDVEKEIEGPLYHGGGARWREGAEIKPGRKTNEWGDEQGKSQHVYFTDKLDVAADYAQRTGGHVFEVEPTGDIKPDHHEGEYKTKHPLRVVRRLDPGEWQVSKQAAQQPYGEQSALHDAGQQDVYAVRDGNSMVMLCGHHADTHVKNRSAADALGDQIGLSPRERSAEMLGQARKGRCAACGRDTAYQLKLLTPRWVQNAQDSRARRKPDKPLKTKPLPSLKQSENAKEPVYYYHGTITEPEEHPDPYANGSHRIQPEWRQDHFEVHPDESKAWHHAISKWKNEGDENDFPRVYRIFRNELKDAEPTSGGGLRVKHPVAGSEVKYHSDEHPPIQLDDEKGPILYHGTTHEHRGDDPDGDYTPLTHISPGTEAGKAPTHGGGVSDPSYAYATKDPHVAWHYADHRAKYGPGGIPHVYRVTPHKPEDVEEDPSHTGDGFTRGNFSGDMRSKSGFKVLDEVPMPRRVQKDYEPSSDHDEDDDDWGESHYGVKLANEQMELFHAEPVKRAPVPQPEPEKPYCDECHEEHTEDEGHRECRACGERHEDYEHKLEHEGSWTDWDKVYPGLNKTVHRTLEPMTLPDHIHDVVHDESRPEHERARVLLAHIGEHHGDNIGMHWSDQRGEGYGADKFAGHGTSEGKTQVMLHAKLPERGHIETDPDELNDNQVISYGDHDEAEVPVSYGSPVHITGVSWRPGGGNQQWRQHHLKEPITMTASKRLPSLRMLAHDATEDQAIRHCFTGDTRYLTIEGTKTLAETVGTLQRVLTAHQGIVHSGRWVDATIHEFGVQPVLRVTLKRNKQTKVIRATPEHRWMVRRPDRTVLTRDLKAGHRLAHLRAPVFGGRPDHDGIRMGAVFGDGYIARRDERTYGGITLWGVKRDLAKYFDEVTTGTPREYLTDNGVPGLRYQSGMAGYTKTLPSLSADLGYLRGWLMGYFAMDGSISASGQMTLSSSSLETLEYVRDIATLLGIGTYAPTSKLRQGYGVEPSPIHQMGFSAADFDESFFLRDDQRLAWRPPVHERYGWTVVSVEDHGEAETVYCPRVPETESFVLEDGIHTFQCPFCGGGKIIGRADGSVECEFCHNFFTVQVQPQYPNFPQTIDGVPQQIPGMPGQVESPGAAPPMDEGGFPPGDEGEDTGDAPPWAQEASEGATDETSEGEEETGDESEPPPFAKKSFRTVAGHMLQEDDYVRHLAIRLAPDRDAMISRVRAERG